jgi:hypothetical protein
MNPDGSVIATSGDWSVTSDGLQWILRKRRTLKGEPVGVAVSFVHSTRDILARCMREKGCPPEAATSLLAAVSSEFSPRQAPDPMAPGKTAESEAVTEYR